MTEVWREEGWQRRNGGWREGWKRKSARERGGKRKGGID